MFLLVFERGCQALVFIPEQGSRLVLGFSPEKF